MRFFNKIKNIFKGENISSNIDGKNEEKSKKTAIYEKGLT